MSEPMRMVCACCITDEIFGICVAYPGKLPVPYPLGAAAVAATMWALGTALGIAAGNILPEFIVNTLSVALYGMTAIIIPACRKDKFLLAGIVAAWCGLGLLPVAMICCVVVLACLIM